MDNSSSFTDAWTDALNRTMRNVQGEGMALPVTNSSQSSIAQTLKELYTNKATASPACQQCDALLTNPMLLSAAPQPKRKHMLLWFVCLALFGVALYMLMRNCRRPRSLGAPHGPPAAVTPAAAPPAASGGALEHVTDPEQIIPTGSGVTFVFFHAPWCGHCKQFMPHFEKAAASTPQATFKAVVNDVLAQSSRAKDLPIQGFPTTYAFKAGQVLDSLVGNQGPEKLKSFIDSALRA